MKACDYCGKQFEPKRAKSRFCSLPCRKRYSEVMGPTKYADNPDYWQVTTPYGGHGFDAFVAASFQRSAHA